MEILPVIPLRTILWTILWTMLSFSVLLNLMCLGFDELTLLQRPLV